MTELSKLSKLVDSSGIRKAFALAAELKSPINLSIGQPDFKTPDELKKSMCNAIMNDKTSYTQTSGTKKLISELKTYLEQEKNIIFDDNELMITSGVSGGIDLLFRSIINHDDEIILPDPYFVMYKNIIRLNGGKPIYIDTYPTFRINIEDIRNKITNNTKAIVINSPGNPTGIVYTKDEIKKISAIAKEKDILIISDEIYEDFVYNGNKHHSPMDFYKNTIVLNGFSKSLGITGLRLGYAYGPKDIIDEMIKLQQFTYVCAPSISQEGVVDFITKKPKELTDAVRRYEENANFIYENLKDLYSLNRPEGAFYIFAKIPKKYLSTEDFISKAIENNLIIVPGNVFSEKDTHFRISFAATKETIEKGVEILKKLS